MTTEYLDQHDPLEKAKQLQAKNDPTHNVELCPGRVEAEKSNNQEELDSPDFKLREKENLPAIDELGDFLSLTQEDKKPDNNNQDDPRFAVIPAKTKREVILRDQSQCTHVDQQGHRCQEKRWLQIHHIEQKSQGGDHDPENLKLLCAGHHKAVHQT